MTPAVTVAHRTFCVYNQPCCKHVHNQQQREHPAALDRTPQAFTPTVSCCAVFTQGERGLQVTGAFLVFAVGLHLIEAARNSAQKKGSTSGTTSDTSRSLA